MGDDKDQLLAQCHEDIRLLLSILNYVRYADIQHALTEAGVEQSRFDDIIERSRD